MVGKVTDDKQMSVSRLPALLGHSPYKSRNEELQHSKDAIAGTLEPWAGNEATGFGNIFEPVCIKIAGERLGVDRLVTDITEPYIHPELPLQASLDAVGEFKKPVTFVTDPAAGIYVVGADIITLDGCGCIENKVTSVRPEDVPALHRGPVQVQGQMMCSGFKWAALCILYGGIEMRIFLFAPHPVTVAAITEAVLDFDQRLETGEWYDLEQSHPGDALLLYPEADEEVPVILEADLSAFAEAILTSKAAIKTCEQVISDATLALQGHMGNHALAKCGGYEIKWGMRNMKAQPEKTTPAKVAKTVRSKSVTVKEVA
jgi:hypothetical protein